VNRFLLDMSTVIAIGRGELDDLGARTESATICALTICGLHHGVLAATDDQRAGRLALLTWVERTFRALPIDERVAAAYGRLALAARAARRETADLLIAATADTHGLTQLTRGENLTRLPGLDAELVTASSRFAGAASRGRPGRAAGSGVGTAAGRRGRRCHATAVEHASALDEGRKCRGASPRRCASPWRPPMPGPGGRVARAKRRKRPEDLDFGKVVLQSAAKS
jgi:predicted nucleic acid-binding protein